MTMKYKGKMEKTDLEGGGWIFRDEKGAAWQLRDLPSELEIEGLRLRIEGEPVKDFASIMMIGNMMQVVKANILE